MNEDTMSKSNVWLFLSPQESSKPEQDTPCLSIKPAGKDFYKVLGVTPESNEDEIKKAYRKLALKFHPDKNSDADAEDRFKEIAEAYEILTDPQKRNIYDQFGEEGKRGSIYWSIGCCVGCKIKASLLLLMNYSVSREVFLKNNWTFFSLCF